MTSQSSAPPAPATIQRHANGIYAPFAMLAGMQLDVFTPLRDGPLEVDALAAATGADARRLGLLLYALVAAGLLTAEDGHFANTAEADRYLVRGRPTYMGNLQHLYTELWGAALLSGDTLRLGAPQAKHDFATMSDDELANFYRASFPGALAAGRQLAALVDLSECRHLVDVGGGSGGVSIALCQARDGLRATVADLPSVTRFARGHIEESDVAARLDVIEADAVAAPPAGTYDAAVLRNLIQVLSADDARRALRHVGAAMALGGRLCILGWMIDDDRTTPFEPVLHNLVFLNFYDDGQAYTEGEHRAWLTEAGFVDVERRALAGNYGLITALKT